MKERIERIGKMLTREISFILQTEIDDPRIHDITITRVDMTRDLRLARVYYVISADKEEKQNVEKALKRHVKHIRGELGHRVSMKYLPRLSFREDKTEESKMSVDMLLEQIEKEHKPFDEAQGMEEGDMQDES